MKKLICLFMLAFVFHSINLEGQKATTMTLAKATGQTNAVPTNLIRVSLERVASTEQLFGIDPGTLVSEVQFGERNGFSTTTPHTIFLLVKLNKRNKYIGEENYMIWDSLDFSATSGHETSHGLDHKFGFTKDPEFLEFFNKTDTTKLEKLFQFVYGKLDPAVCFFNQKVEEYSKKTKVVFLEKPSMEAPFTIISEELFAECITSLDSYCWESKVVELYNSDKETFRLYGRLLFLLKNSIQKRLGADSKVPIITLLQSRLEQMKKMQIK